jgi:hypothetical protein
MWLALWAAVFALPAVAAPVPVGTPASQGTISDYLRLRETIPQTTAPHAGPAVMVGDGTLEMERRIMVYVPVTEVMTVQQDGKNVQVARTTYRTTAKVEMVRVKVDGCKFFSVTKEGKLEALETAKATGMLKKRTAILAGEGCEVDPRHLELIKPGTLYLLVPQPEPTLNPPPIPPLPPRVKD